MKGFHCLYSRCIQLLLFSAGSLFLAISSYGQQHDSLSIAFQSYDASQFQRALPVLIRLSDKYKSSDVERYVRCQLRIANIFRIYGAPRVALEMVKANEEHLKVRLERSTVADCENLLIKGECFYDLNRNLEHKASTLLSIKRRKELNGSAGNPATEYLQLARYYQNVPNSRDSVEYWAKEALRLAKRDRNNFAYLLPRIYNLLGFHIHLLNNRYYKNKPEFYRVIKASRKYYDSALLSIKRQPVIDEYMLSKVYHNLGNSFNNETFVTQKHETLSKSLSFYNKSVALVEKYGNPSELALKDWVIAAAYGRLALLDSQVYFFQQGMTRLMPEYQPRSIYDVPNIASTKNDKLFSTFPSQIQPIFRKKYEEMGHNIKDLIAAYNYGKFTIEFYQHLINHAKSDEETIHGFYVFIDPNYQWLAGITSTLVKETSDKSYLNNIYPNLVDAKYAFMNKQDFDGAPSAEEINLYRSESEVLRSNIKRINPEINFDVLFKHLLVQIKENKKVNNERPNRDVDILTTIQQNLKPNEAVIDYYYAETFFSVVTITKDELSINKYPGAIEARAKLATLRKSMMKINPSQFATKSNWLYQYLLDSTLRELPPTINKLIICPDVWLAQIPWDALVTDTTNHSFSSFKELQYLKNKYDIQIVLTLKHLLRKPDYFNDNFYGVASNFASSKRFSALPFSSALVKKKANDYSGEVNSILPEDSVRTKIFHLASHIKADSLRPFQSTVYLGDYDSVLLRDIPTKKYKVGLALLNGCESTGIISFSGEGSIGFARSFYRAGAQSVLMTTWSVDDKATADILKIFYNNLENGEALDIALKKAKNKFIEDAASDDLANPYYWAGLQLTGNTTPLFEKSFASVAIYSSLGAGLVLGMIYFVRRKTKVIRVN